MLPAVGISGEKSNEVEENSQKLPVKPLRLLSDYGKL